MSWTFKKLITFKITLNARKHLPQICDLLGQVKSSLEIISVCLYRCVHTYICMHINVNVCLCTHWHTYVCIYYNYINISPVAIPCLAWSSLKLLEEVPDQQLGRLLWPPLWKTENVESQYWSAEVRKGTALRGCDLSNTEQTLALRQSYKNSKCFNIC